MKVISALTALLCALVLSGCGSFVSKKDVMLVDEGKPVASILLPEKPTRAAQLAAFEIQEHVKLITGAELPIIRGAAGGDGARIYVGATDAAAALAPFKDQEYAVSFQGGDIIIAGKDKQDFGEVKYWHSGNPTIEGCYDYMSWPQMFDAKGTLHAAYDFLEQCCGVRWFDQTEFGTDVANSKTLKVTPKDIRRTPAFSYSDAGYIAGNMELFDRESSLWTVRWSESTPKFQEWLDLIYEKGRKLPACTSHPHRWLAYERSHVFAFLTRRKIGGEPFKTNHSFYGWYDRFWEKNPKNPDVFVAKKPEWFAQGYPDEKVPPQLCYTNPEVVKQCLADARAFFALPEEERQKARLGTDKFFPVVPMDNGSFCKCPNCTKLCSAGDAGPEFSNGQHSALVWSFVNQVAKGLKQSNPDKMISALAYASYAWRPKGMDIEKNIAVQMCLFPQAAANNPKMLDNDDMILNQWADGRPLYLWLYTGLTTGHKPQVPMFPAPMADHYGPLMRKYSKSGVKGIFFNGIPQETDAYFLFKLTDDPFQDTEKLMDDYFTRMYGPKAGPTLKEFYKFAESIYANPRNYPQGAKGPELYYGTLGTGPRMRKLSQLVKQAEEQLADAPEIWKKRFAVFKLGTWEYMRQGRESYEKSKVAKASSSIAVACPVDMLKPDISASGEIDWRDAQSFGGFNGWLKDSGDISLRKITSRMIHDGKNLHISLDEKDMDSIARDGDSWEILMRSPDGKSFHKLFIAASGKITGQIIKDGGAPQEWSTHGARAVSKISDREWNLAFSMPIPESLREKDGRLFFNIRRNDAAGEDSPVLVATGDSFDSGKTGATVSFDMPLAGELKAPTDKDLMLDWDFKGEGEKVADISGHGNDGTIFGKPRRTVAGLDISDGGQYVEIPMIKGVDETNWTLNMWFKYPDADRQGHLLIYRNGSVEARLGVPHRQMGFLNQDPDGKLLGADGPAGVELAPKTWNMITFANDGRKISVYENGRFRFALNAERYKPVGTEELIWRFGGSPKRPPWYSFIGTIGKIQMYKTVMTPEEVMAKYLAEIPKYRKP